jgi:hypothetical protein
MKNMKQPKPKMNITSTKQREMGLRMKKAPLPTIAPSAMGTASASVKKALGKKVK